MSFPINEVWLRKTVWMPESHAPMYTVWHRSQMAPKVAGWDFKKIARVHARTHTNDYDDSRLSWSINVFTQWQAAWSEVPTYQCSSWDTHGKKLTSFFCCFEFCFVFFEGERIQLNKRLFFLFIYHPSIRLFNLTKNWLEHRSLCFI